MAALAAARNAGAVPAPSAESWTKHWPRPTPHAAGRTAAAPKPFHNLKPDRNAVAATPLRISRKGYNRYNQRAATIAGGFIAGEHDYARRARSRRLSQQGAPARADRDQPILAALSSARQLGLQVARQAVAQGI